MAMIFESGDYLYLDCNTDVSDDWDIVTPAETGVGLSYNRDKIGWQDRPGDSYVSCSCISPGDGHYQDDEFEL